MINVMVFGQLEDVTGASMILLDDVSNTDLLTETLFKQYPLLKNKKFLLAVNKQIISGTTNIDSSAEIALLPPFSGG